MIRKLKRKRIKFELKREKKRGKIGENTKRMSNSDGYNDYGGNNDSDSETHPLFLAIFGKNLDGVKAEIAKLVTPSDLSKIRYDETTGQTPIIAAAGTGNHAIMREILKIPGLDINSLSAEGDINALIYAVRNEDIEMVKILLEAGASPNRHPETEFAKYASTPLVDAIDLLNKDIIEILLAAGANVNESGFVDGFPEKITPLMGAIRHKRMDIIALLLSIESIDINQQLEYRRYTALTFACNELQHQLDDLYPILSALLSAGADPNRADANNYNSLYNLLFFVTDFYQGSDFPSEKEEELLECVKALVEGGADVNNNISANPKNGTPLSLALLSQLKSIVTYLLTIPSIEVSIKTGSPLYVSCYGQNTREFFDLIIAHPASDINFLYNVIGGKKKSLLYRLCETAAGADSAEVFTAVINTPGIDLNLGNVTDGVTPLIIAIIKGIDILAMQLLDKDSVDVNKQIETTQGGPFELVHGGTALYYACKKKKISLVRRLLERGADPSIEITSLHKSVIELAENDIFAEEINLIFAPPRMWKGLSRGDVERLDIIFEMTAPVGARAPAEDWSLCPICMGYTGRQQGCKYMKHDCREQQWYHKKLYERYKDDGGHISWCTVCGRICNGHKHYKLQPFTEEHPTEVQIPPVTETAVFYTSDCRPEGGGGIDEKFIRFRRYKEYAKELNEEVEKMKFSDAMEQLAEEMWNAPFHRLSKKRIEGMHAAKAFNIATANFPENVKIAKATEEKKLDYRRSPGTTFPTIQIPVGGSLSTTLGAGAAGGATTSDMAEDAVGFAVDGNVIYFHHQELLPSTSIKDHKSLRQGIGEGALINHIQESLKSFGVDPAFGKCPFHSEGCNALLFPEELCGIIPTTLYARYRNAFNRVYELRKKAEKEGYDLTGVPYDPAIPYCGAVGGAGLAGGGYHHHQRYHTRARCKQNKIRTQKKRK